MDTTTDTAFGTKLSAGDVKLFVESALSQAGAKGLAEMLRCVSKSLGAYGAILWATVPSTDCESLPPCGHLFARAAWFPEARRYELHNLPLAGTVTGDAVCLNQPQWVPSVEKDGRLLGRHRFIEEANIVSLCSFPIAQLDGMRGALTVYWQASEPHPERFSDCLAELVPLIPTLHRVLQEQKSFSLIQMVEAALHQVDVEASMHPPKLETQKHAILEICKAVSDTFQCFETSVFLENKREDPGAYRLLATVWEDDIAKQVYYAGDTSGITGWVLTHGKTVRIFDKAKFERDQASIQLEYPGLRWGDTLTMENAVRSRLNIPDEEPLPPLSCMIIPIRMGGYIHGVIRCCAARMEPYYFTKEDVERLEIVASQIGRAWSNWSGRISIEAKNRSWQTLVRGMAAISTLLSEDPAMAEEDLWRIMRTTLLLAKRVIRGADILAARLPDSQGKFLHFVATVGKEWEQGTEDEQKRRKNIRVSLKGQSASIAAQVFYSRKPHVSPKEGERVFDLFPQVKHLLCVPIVNENKSLGVLDLWSTSSQRFSKSAEIISRLLGRQLGLYIAMARTLREQRRLQDEQRNAFKDLAHQIKTPIMTALARVQSSLRSVERERIRTDSNFSKRLEIDLVKLRGICRKARRVTTSSKLLTDLSRGMEIEIRRSTLDLDRLVKLLIELAQDHTRMLSPVRDVQFWVNRDSFEIHSSYLIELDWDLLEQCLNNILDNAGKYCFDGTQIEIFGGTTKRERFFISVLSTGIPIEKSELARCTERGWRSPEAKRVTGEGSGIGLWIVDNIMNAHGGWLVIEPKPESQIEVKLVFPQSSYRGNNEIASS